MAKKEEQATNNNDVEGLRKEYEVCFDNWRFFVGLRFTVLAFFMTLNSGLLYAFFNMFSDNQKEWFLILPPLAGVLSIYAGWIIENRNIQLYYACILRAKEIEKKLDYEENAAKKVSFKHELKKEEKIKIEELANKNCIAVLLDHCCPVGRFNWMTLGIRVIYSGFLFMWAILFSISVTYFFIKMSLLLCKLFGALNHL